MGFVECIGVSENSLQQPTHTIGTDDVDSGEVRNRLNCNVSCCDVSCHVEIQYLWRLACDFMNA